LTRHGIKVVLLEAGKRQSTETFSQVPGEAFGQLTWLDVRTQSGNWGVSRVASIVEGYRNMARMFINGEDLRARRKPHHARF
jgi:choline dehydrogenase-like flavoprotein